MDGATRDKIKRMLASGATKSSIIAALVEESGLTLYKARAAVQAYIIATGEKTAAQVDAEKLEEHLAAAQVVRDEGGSLTDALRAAMALGYAGSYDSLQRSLLHRRRRDEKKYKTPVPPKRKARPSAGYDVDEIRERVGRFFDQKKARYAEPAELTYDAAPVCLVFVGDQHLGSPGTDHDRCFYEATLIAETPGMRALLMGDIVDNMIIGRLAAVRAVGHSRVTIAEEWELCREYFRTLGDSVDAVVSGNHDHWTYKLAGVDVLRGIVGEFIDRPIYDSDDLRLKINVGDWTTEARLRHKWKGSSQYNPTHAIEKAAKWDGDFTLGIGAHTHVGGVARGFIAQRGASGLAVQVGAYKRIDSFAREIGFPYANNSTAVAVLFDPATESMTGFENLETAARVMRALYS